MQGRKLLELLPEAKVNQVCESMSQAMRFLCGLVIDGQDICCPGSGQRKAMELGAFKVLGGSFSQFGLFTFILVATENTGKIMAGRNKN